MAAAAALARAENPLPPLPARRLHHAPPSRRVSVLRDWDAALRRAEALLRKHRHAPWFRGVRAYEEPSAGGVAVELQVFPSL